MQDLKLNKRLTFDKDLVKSPNLTSSFGEEDLDAIGGWVWDGYFRDKVSRYKWEKRTEAALDLALQVQKNKTFPWPGSSNVIFPLITIAALQFSSKSYSNIIQGTDVVRYRIIGDDEGGILKARAERIGRHMSWQVLEEDEAWEEQHDRLLINLAIVGTNFVKTFFCNHAGAPVGELVTAQDLVLDYYAKSVDSAARKTQCLRMSRNEIWENCARGIWRDVRKDEWFCNMPTYSTYDQSEPKKDNREGQEPPQSDSVTPLRTLEQHVDIDFDDDGYAEPYIITIEEQTHCVCRIVSRIDNYDTQVDVNGKGELLGIRPTEFFTKYGFIPSPDGAIYDLGFGTFLGPINESVNTGINQIFDYGTMMNSIGGFLGRGAKIRGGVYTMAPWEWKRVDAPGDDLRKNIVPYERDNGTAVGVLFQMVGLLIEYANRVAGTMDTQVGENPGQNTPAETFRGMQEQGMAVYGTIFKRVWRSMKDEFKKRYLVNRHSLDINQPKRFGVKGLVRAEDYIGSEDEIAPVADPNVPSATMRINQSIAVTQRAMVVPGYEIPEVEKSFLKSLRVEDIDRLYPGPGNTTFQMPNPKLQVEQGKQAIKQMELKYKAMELQMTLMEQKRVNTATIDKLKAEAAKLLASIGVDKAEAAIKGFELMLKTIESQNAYIDAQQQKLKESDDASTSDATGGDGQAGAGGSPQLAPPPSNANGAGGASGAANGAAGAMG